MLLLKQPVYLICCLHIIYLLLLPGKFLRAQNPPKPTIDQLIKQLETAKPDTNKVNLLDEIADLYRSPDRDKAQGYANQALELAQRLNWVKGQVKAYYTLGWLNGASGEEQQAFDYYQKGFELAQKYGLISLQYQLLVRRAGTSGRLGKRDQQIQDYKSAVEYYLHTKEIDAESTPLWYQPALFVMLDYSIQNKAEEGESYCQRIISMFLKEKDSLHLRTAYKLIGSFFRFRDLDKALSYSLNGLKYFHTGDTTSSHAYYLTWVALLHTLTRNYVKALDYYQQAILLNPYGNSNVKNSANSGIRTIYTTLGDYNKALNIDLQLMKEYSRLADRWMMTSLYRDLANDYMQLEHYDQALLQLDKALRLNDTLKNSFEKSQLLLLLAKIYYRMKRYDEAMHAVLENLDKQNVDESTKQQAYFYMAMIIRDAPDEVLRKYNIATTERYQLVIKNMASAMSYFKKKNMLADLQVGYKELSATYEMTNDYKASYEAYKSYIVLRDSAVNRDNQNAFLSKVAELQFEKREDSLKYQQRLTEEKLQQQTFLATQQHQNLQLNQQKLDLLSKEKDLQGLNYLKTQSDLQAEQNKRKANEKQLSLSQKEQALATTTVRLQKAELKGKLAQSRYLLAGIAGLLVLSFFIGRNYYNQRRSNRLLTTANTQITQANQEITDANQQITLANKQITAEKQRSDSLLLNILPADVAEELKEKGSAGARLYEEVTVLFTDFVNFTTIGELLTPQELVDELHTCFKAFDDIIGSYNIEKIKTIGDAYLAVAGLPNADPGHAFHTVQAALNIRQFIHNRKERMGSRSFDIRIGIHSGSVVAGIVGVKKFAYDIWGDTVNTAARMEQHSVPGQINLSEETYELVKDQFTFTYRGEIEAKNKGALKMYFVEKLSAIEKVNR